MINSHKRHNRIAPQLYYPKYRGGNCRKWDKHQGKLPEKRWGYVADPQTIHVSVSVSTVSVTVCIHVQQMTPNDKEEKLILLLVRNF